MTVTEQIDALEAVAVDSFKYLAAGWDGVAVTLFLERDALRFAEPPEPAPAGAAAGTQLEACDAVDGGRVSEQSRIASGAIIGALVGAIAGYLFFTERGAQLRDRMEPLVDDMRREFIRVERTVQKIASMAGEGLRAAGEFNEGRSRSAR